MQTWPVTVVPLSTANAGCAAKTTAASAAPPMRRRLRILGLVHFSFTLYLPFAHPLPARLRLCSHRGLFLKFVASHPLWTEAVASGDICIRTRNTHQLDLGRMGL